MEEVLVVVSSVIDVTVGQQDGNLLVRSIGLHVADTRVMGYADRSNLSISDPSKVAFRLYIAATGSIRISVLIMMTPGVSSTSPEATSPANYSLAETAVPAVGDLRQKFYGLPDSLTPSPPVDKHLSLRDPFVQAARSSCRSWPAA